MPDEKVHVEFTIPAGNRDKFMQWLQLATEADQFNFVLGYRADDFIQRRQALVGFVDAMELTLRRHDHKTTWRDRPIEALVKLMELEIREFDVAREFFEVKEARKELVDIGNYAMILWDRLSMLDQDKELRLQRE